MLFPLVFLVCFSACVIGALCGIGGGVIIKPALDALGVMDAASISFLSGCTVLVMSAYSVARSKSGGGSRIDPTTGGPLALGAALGGVVGKWLFQALCALWNSPNLVGAVQAACLLAVTAGTLLYTLRKNRIATLHVKNRAVCGIIGLTLGVMSSFLGIGGGPINLVVLYYFFSMDTKTAAENSLYIILFSQIASLLLGLATRSVPEFSPWLLALMAAGGICGGICGRGLNRRVEARTIDRLFLGLMGLIILINIYNIFRFLRPI